MTCFFGFIPTHKFVNILPLIIVRSFHPSGGKLSLKSTWQIQSALINSYLPSVSLSVKNPEETILPSLNQERSGTSSTIIGNSSGDGLLGNSSSFCKRTMRERLSCWFLCKLHGMVRGSSFRVLPTEILLT